jgi:putative ABC transport system permease protein
MNLIESFRIALRALNANKIRSALTMLGVIIGVAAVILLVSLGTGVQSQITGQIAGLGSNLLFVLPGDVTSGGGGGGGAIVKQFTLADVSYLRTRLGPADTVIPELEAMGEVRAANKQQTTQIVASDENVKDAAFGDIETGRWFARGEVVGASRVVILGVNVRDKLYPGQDPVGRTVAINGTPFRVIGQLQTRGGGFGGTQDNFIIIPITTAQQLLGTNNISAIFVRTPDAQNIDALKAQVEMAMRVHFNDPFTVLTQEQTLTFLSTILGTLTAMLAGLASISLLVGGIGIMNIMLVSVSERTREIGIRKAVGARTYDILSQFVIEAMMLSIVGGAIGIGLGAGGAYALHQWVPAEVTWWAVTLAFVFSAAVGIFFGVYPAWRASRLNPIEALRYE